VGFPFRSDRPYYYQIREHLLKRIWSGEFPAGSQLPSESELAAAYGVSRPTIRQAVADLVQEGVLTRARGKGTFVAPPAIAADAEIFQSFAEEMSARGVRHTARLVSAQEIEATESAAADLEVRVGEPVYEVTRVRLGDGEPLVIRTLQIPARVCPGLLERDLERVPLYEVLRRETGLVASGSVQWFSAVRARKDEALLLDVEPGGPLLLWRGVTYTAEGTPLARTKALYRADRYRFRIRQGSMAVGARRPNLDMVEVG
jgi:GntR family transcriptional regulator